MLHLLLQRASVPFDGPRLPHVAQSKAIDVCAPIPSLVHPIPPDSADVFDHVIDYLVFICKASP